MDAINVSPDSAFERTSLSRGLQLGSDVLNSDVTTGDKGLFNIAGTYSSSIGQPDDGLSTSTILKLKGLPYSCTEQDIKLFFAGYSVKRVAWVSEPDGRPSGLAFAEFGTKEEALKALAKNGEYIGERYVRLLHVPRQEMEEQVRMGTLAIPGAAAKLRARMLRGQPRVANNGMNLMSPGVLQLVPPGTLPGNTEGASPAVFQTMRTVGPQSMRTLGMSTGQHFVISGPAQGSNGHYTLQAMPRNSAGGTFAVQQGGATYTVQGLPAGTAYAMQSPVSYPVAAGSHYALSESMPIGVQVAAAGPMESRNWQGNSSYQQANMQTQMRGASYHSPAMALTAQFQSMNLGAGMGSNSGMLTTTPAGGNVGSQMLQGSSQVLQAGSQMLPAGLNSGGQMMQQQAVLVPMQTMQSMQPLQAMQSMQPVQSMQSSMQHSIGMQPVNSRFAQQQAAAAAAQAMQATSGPTIKIRGLPFRSSPADILAFFQGYAYLPDSLQIGLDQLGRPSGEAWLTFSSPTEALRGVRDLNRHYLGNRYLELTLC